MKNKQTNRTPCLAPICAAASGGMVPDTKTFWAEAEAEALQSVTSWFPSVPNTTSFGGEHHPVTPRVPKVEGGIFIDDHEQSSMAPLMSFFCRSAKTL